MQTLFALLTFLVFTAGFTRSVMAEGDGEKADVEALITRLTELDAEGAGLSSGMTGGDFPPVAGQFSFQMGLLSPRPALSNNDVLTQLVALGPGAMPALLKHLDDKRATKLVINSMAGGGMWYATEIRSAGHNPAERQALKEAGIDEEKRNEGDGADKHTISVGDSCFVALGMITNRGYAAVRYQPTACIVINSPVHSPELAKGVRNIWGAAGEKAGRDALLAWLREDFRQGSTGAATRLLYYFPEESPAEILEVLQRKGREPYQEQYLLRATAWTPHEGIRAEVQKKVMAADDAGLAAAGAAAFRGGKDPADYNHLTKLITRWKAGRDGVSAAQAFLDAALSSWPDRREETLELFFKKASRECILAGIECCYGAGPLPVRPLMPLLGRKEDGYGRYLIQGEGVRKEPKESDFLDCRVCDNIWEVISRSLGDTKATCTGDRKTMDRRIRALQARLKSKAAAWPLSAAEIAARQAEQNQAARAKAAALQDVDDKKPSPALRALMILQEDQAGMELWLESATRLLVPPAENENSWPHAVDNRHRYKTRLLDELTTEERKTLGTTLARRAMAALDAVSPAAWPGEDATALVCLRSCLPAGSDSAVLKAALLRLRVACTRNGWPKDADLRHLIKTMEVLLEHRTPEAGGLLLRLAETSNPDTVSLEMREFFLLIADYQDVPEAREAAEFCFLSRRSPWHLSKCNHTQAGEFGSAGLLQSAAFRRALTTALSNETTAGKVTIDKENYCWTEWNGGGSSGEGVEKGDAAGVKPGGEMPVRRCDLLLSGIANAFYRREGPDFKIYWPHEKREKARQEWLDYLAKRR